MIFNYTVWKSSLGWEVSERMHKLHVCVKRGAEELLTPLQMDLPIPPHTHSAVNLSSLVGPTVPFCNQFISHTWDHFLDTHSEVTI